ncbi:MAG: hypothetical protein BWX69_03278 [Planctomycetes bacterium ADurb.Bin069]|nr:MAG: hypothetical protein BWX69_03278 [Planctomycetes bacterium ADurb.Bin069]
MGACVTEVRRAAPRFIRAFAARLRETDAREVLGATGVARDGIAEHIAREISDDLAAGGRVWAVIGGRGPLALFGARPDSLTADTAAIWMLATREADARPLEFARVSRRCLDMVFKAFPDISDFYNFVPERAERTVAWLRWLDAWLSVPDRFISPWTGELFARFTIEREEARHV